MNIPNYIKDLMKRAKYNYTLTGNNYAVGYTIDISKKSEYQTADTFRAEIRRLENWAKRNNADCVVISAPILTRHTNQTATVTIYDPVMKYLQKFIKEA